ncbi:MAG: hypothetical protein IJZ23_09275 [Roseburia sp.]|nr:hypothetical protein [Roseburia sp.]
MVALLELKEKLVRIYGKYEAYITPLLRFLLAFVAFMLINANIGYMKMISSTPIALILAAVCSVLPVNAMIALAALVILLDLYALSLEVCVVGVLLFAFIYFVYFRFSPRYGYNAVLMPVCFKLGIPYIMPVGSGLLGEMYSVVSVICGSVIYFFLRGVHENETALSSAAESAGGATSKIVIAINQLLMNKEMFLVVAIFAVTTIVVYIIRRMDIDNAWLIAWIAGILFETIGLISGYLLLGISGKIVGVILGGIVSAGIALVLQFMFFNVDYTRTERLQFEDDEYYYYVKAVPKAVIAGSDKKVKHFHRNEEKERLTRKKFAEEMDIDEELLN